MDNIQRLIHSYKHYVVNLGTKSAKELFQLWLKKDFVVAVDLNDKQYTDIEKSALICVLESEQFQNSGLTKEDLKFLCFVIKDEGAGKEYYDLLRSNDCDEEIYATIEENMCYISCNCTKLSLDLSIDRGISQEDYDQNTIALANYLFNIEAIDKGWY